MSGRGLVLKTLRDQRNILIGMSAGAFLITLGILALYPQVADQFAGIELPDFYDIFLGEAPIDSPEGFLAAEFFSWMPLLFIALAVIAGTAAIASEESNGTLELLMAEPVRRRDLVLRKTLALMLVFLVISAVSLAAMVLATVVVRDFELAFTRMLSATTLMLLVVWFFLGMSLLASAALPSRGSAAAVVTALIVLAYFVNLVATLVQDLSFLQNLTPFGWADYTGALLHSMPWLQALVFVGFFIVFVVGAVVSFERRDIGAATWPVIRRGPLKPSEVAPGGEPKRAS